MKKQTKSSLTRKLDKEVSRIVRARGACQWCQKMDYASLQCAHVFSRTYRNTRWNLDNLVNLCQSCHFRAHREPIEFTEFIKILLGEPCYAMLRFNHNAIKRWTIPEMSELLETLRKL